MYTLYVEDWSHFWQDTNVILSGFSTIYCCQQYLYVLMSVIYECRSIDGCVFSWRRVSEVYVFQYTVLGGNTYLCIYSIYIESVSFVWNMQTATWWSDSTEVHLQDKVGCGGRGWVVEWEGLSCMAALALLQWRSALQWAKLGEKSWHFYIITF